MTDQEYVVFGDVETLDPSQKKSKVEVDLTRYKEALLTILPFPPLTKALPVNLTNQRGHSASVVKQRFQAALETLNGQVKDMDVKKVKLTFRSATPGVMPITKMYVKWAPREDKSKTDKK